MIECRVLRRICSDAVELRLEFPGENMARRFSNAPRVDPGDSLERRVLDVLKAVGVHDQTPIELAVVRAQD